MIQLEGNTVLAINPEVSLDIDVDKIKENILENYKGEFLHYFYIKNCLEFEIWMENCRQELKEQYILAAKKETERLLEKRQYMDAVKYAGQLMDHFYLDESFYRKLLTILTEEGEYSTAMNLYQKLETMLMRELEEEPEAETKLLMETLLKLRKRVTERPENEQQFFWGRQKEICDIFDTARGHQSASELQTPGMVLLSGEAGVGKTALLNQVKALLEEENYLLFSFGCCAAENDLYLRPWNDILKQIQEFYSSQKKEPKGSAELFTSDITDYRLFVTQYGSHFEDLLRSLCKYWGGGRIIIVFDDIQWMDPSSIQLLNTLIFRLRSYPFFVIAASRNDHPAELLKLRVSLMRDGLLKEVQLNRFTLEETTKLLEKCAKEYSEQPEYVEEIFRYTDGNALFLTECLKMIKENKERGIQKSPMSPRTISIIQGRLLNLTKAENDLLSALSIFPYGASIEELSVLYPEPELRLYSLLESLLTHQIIVEKQEDNKVCYNFTHALIHNYILLNISAGRRQVYHRAVAVYYEEKYMETGNIDLMPVLIYHFDNAGDIYKKYTYKLEYIKAFFAGKEEIYPSLSASFSNNFFQPDIDAGENILIPLAQEIRALPGENRNYRGLRMKVEYLIGRNDLSCGDYEMGLRNIEACIEAAKYLENAEYLMDSYLQMVYYAIQVYDLDMMKKYVHLCEELLKVYSYPEPILYSIERLQALYDIKMKLYDEAVEILEKLIPRLETLLLNDSACATALAACYNYRGEIYMEAQKWEKAQGCINKAVTCCYTNQPTAGLGMSYTNMGIILYQMNCYDKASEYLKKARKCFQNISIEWGRTKEELYSALLDLKMGNEKSASEHYKSACRYAGKDYSPQTKAMLWEVYQSLAGLPGAKPEKPPARGE